MDIGYHEFQYIFDKVRSYGVPHDLMEPIEGAVNLLLIVCAELSQAEAKSQRDAVTIRRLKKMLFGKGTTVDAEASQTDSSAPDTDKDSPTQSSPRTGDDSQKQDKKPDPKDSSAKSRKGKGHGCLGADAYTGAAVHQCKHSQLKPGAQCPLCERGRVYLLKDPSSKIIVTGQAPLVATRYDLERFRCALCQAYFTAELPEGLSDKYTPSARATLAILHLWAGMTYYALERIQANMGMPIPASTQSDKVLSSAGPCFAIFNKLIFIAANRDWVMQDDTYAPVIELKKDNRDNDPDRKGMYTSVFIAPGDQPIVLYFSGRNHAGENFDKIMKDRDPTLKPINRMADAIAANTKHKAKSININCNAHAVTKLKDVVYYHELFSQILSVYEQVFVNDLQCQKDKLNPDQRLIYHQQFSSMLMEQIYQLVTDGMVELEPNSVGYGELKYIFNHWHELTAFLRIPGSPLTNNYSERMLKSCIKYRKNSLRYNTCYSAQVKSTIMSVIATAYENKVNAHHYLTAIFTHSEHVWRSPERWLPWNYTHALSELTGCQSSAMAA